jgi:hypothetical protein
MAKTESSDKYLQVLFDPNNEPIFKFYGAWNIRDVGHVRGNLLRAYKHYVRDIRIKEATK